MPQTESKASIWKRIGLGILAAVIVCAIALFAFVMYRDDQKEMRGLDQAHDDVLTCLKQGGDPEYTVDSKGTIIQFLYCKD